MSKPKEEKQSKDLENGATVSSDLSMLSLAWELGYMIAIPIVIFTLGGAFLDKQMGTSPWMLLGGVGFSIMLTSVMVYYKMMKILGEINGKSEDGDKFIG